MTITLQAAVMPESHRAHKILAVAAFAGVKVDTAKVEYGVTNESCEYLRKNHPLGRFPSLETPEGNLFESNAIVRYLARAGEKNGKSLYGRNAFESSEVDMWLDFAATEIDRASVPFIMNFYLGEAVTAAHQEGLNEVLVGLDNWLEIRTYLVSERMTVADIVVAFSLQATYRFNAEGENLSKKYKNVFRLYNTVMQQPTTVEVLKAVGGTFGVRKVEKPKEEKPKEEKPKKEEKKPAAKDEDDGEGEEEFQEKKKPNPLDLLPPSNFVLDAFKREYSNNDTRTVAAPYFFANFDAAGYSAFWCRYKYNEDNKMQFMTANLVRGWFQRMEHTRKYAFGISLIIGEEKVHEIVALWVFRGKGLPEIVREVEDTELFEWEEIADINAQKEQITDYLCWEGPTIGKPVLEGRCFK